MNCLENTNNLNNFQTINKSPINNKINLDITIDYKKLKNFNLNNLNQ